MRRPLEGAAAFVLGTGPDLPADRLDAFRPYFTIGVGQFWRVASGFVPAVSFWVDGAVPKSNPAWLAQGQLCVCDRGTATRPEHLGLPILGGPLPRRQEMLDPRRLYHRPHSGVVAALWAVSLGCWPVVLCGMGCEDDGRPGGRRGAMRRALHELLGRDYRRPGDWRPTIWHWDRRVVDTPAVWQSCVHSPRLSRADLRHIRANLQRFYATKDTR